MVRIENYQVHLSMGHKRPNQWRAFKNMGLTTHWFALAMKTEKRDNRLILKEVNLIIQHERKDRFLRAK